MGELWVWVDQDLCTGDGLCTDHCPEVFRLLDDGLSYVMSPGGVVHHDPGGAAEPATVPAHLTDAAVAAATDCPGECIFLEEHPDGTAPARPTPPTSARVDDDGREDPADVPRPAPAKDAVRWPSHMTVHWDRPGHPPG